MLCNVQALVPCPDRWVWVRVQRSRLDLLEYEDRARLVCFSIHQKRRKEREFKYFVKKNSFRSKYEPLLVFNFKDATVISLCHHHFLRSKGENIHCRNYIHWIIAEFCQITVYHSLSLFKNLQGLSKNRKLCSCTHFNSFHKEANHIGVLLLIRNMLWLYIWV
jgi:hypothetical protein